MAEVCFFPCPIFPGEVEDYYCTSCHTTCSGLSLLVGPHTGHNRVPLTDAAKYIPAALRRDAAALVTKIHEEYIRPKTAHCNTLQSTLAQMHQDRQRKWKELEELQRELYALDKKIDSLTQDSAMALCHWVHRRDGFVKEARQLLRGADSLSKVVCTQEKGSIGVKRSMKCGAAASSATLQHFAVQAVVEELHEVRRLLTRPLEWLEHEEEYEEGKDNDSEEKKWWKTRKETRQDPRAMNRTQAAFTEGKKEKYYYWQKDGRKDMSCHGNSNPILSSDAEAVLDQLMTAHVKQEGLPHTQVSPSAEKSVNEKDNDDHEDDVSSCDSFIEEHATKERQRWRHDVKRRERLLRNGLDRCLHDDIPPKRGAAATATTIIAGDDETEVNDISSSSGCGSVSEIVAHILRKHQNGNVNKTSPSHIRSSHSYSLDFD